MQSALTIAFPVIVAYISGGLLEEVLRGRKVLEILIAADGLWAFCFVVNQETAELSDRHFRHQLPWQYQWGTVKVACNPCYHFTSASLNCIDPHNPAIANKFSLE